MYAHFNSPVLQQGIFYGVMLRQEKSKMENGKSKLNDNPIT